MVDSLDQKIAYYRSLTFADSTKRSYSTHLAAFLKFCQLINRPPTSPDSRTVMRFIAYLADKLQYSSIPQYANIVRLICAEKDEPNPLQSWPVQSLLRGIKRAKGNSTVHKLPITPQLLLHIRQLVSLNEPADIVLWAAYLTSFFTLLRKSNIVPPSPSTFDPLRHPRRSDLVLTPMGLALNVALSKNNQFQERALKIPLPFLKEHPLCPTTALLAVLALQPDLPPSVPLFAYPTHKGLRILTQSIFTRRLHQLVEATGAPASRYGSHSFRRGGATWAFQAGLPGELIQVMGDWHSECYKQYLEFDLNTKFNLMHIFSKDLPTSL